LGGPLIYDIAPANNPASRNSFSAWNSSTSGCNPVLYKFSVEGTSTYATIENNDAVLALIKPSSATDGLELCPY
jgi:hypothetical protein